MFGNTLQQNTVDGPTGHPIVEALKWRYFCHPETLTAHAEKKWQPQRRHTPT
jgi:hypothetical protein